MKNLFLVIAGLITIGSVLPYIRDIIKGKTKPNIVSWFTWTILTGIATIAEVSAHEYRTAIFTGAAVVETAIVVILGLKYGDNKYTKFDVYCQLGAILGLVLWALFDSPALAVIAVVSIDFIGALPTLRHSWMKPGEETWITFALAGLGAVFALFALTAYNWTSLTYAVYIVAINIVMSTILITRAKKHAHLRSVNPPIL